MPDGSKTKNATVPQLVLLGAYRGESIPCCVSGVVVARECDEGQRRTQIGGGEGVVLDQLLEETDLGRHVRVCHCRIEHPRPTIGEVHPALEVPSSHLPPPVRYRRLQPERLGCTSTELGQEILDLSAG